jgi:hypothetical protein
MQLCFNAFYSYFKKNYPMPNGLLTLASFLIIINSVAAFPEAKPVENMVMESEQTGKNLQVEIISVFKLILF